VDSIWRRKLHLDALDGNSKRQKLGQARQELGAFGNQETQVCPSREIPRLKPLRHQGQRAAPPQKQPELQKGPGTYKEALTNIKIAIFRETYPEDKVRKTRSVFWKNCEGCCVGLQ
jgi:hypothetical protein